MRRREGWKSLSGCWISGWGMRRTFDSKHETQTIPNWLQFIGWSTPVRFTEQLEGLFTRTALYSMLLIHVVERKDVFFTKSQDCDAEWFRDRDSYPRRGRGAEQDHHVIQSHFRTVCQRREKMRKRDREESHHHLHDHHSRQANRISFSHETLLWCISIFMPSFTLSFFSYIWIEATSKWEMLQWFS